MTVNPQRLARLQEHGLTEYESRAYLALLELEKAEASQIADLSRVPRTKIYQALDGLEGKKLIKVIPDRPKRYLVQSFTVYLDELQRQFQAKATEVSDQKAALAAEFAPRGNISLEDTGGFLALKGRANIASKMCELLEKAKTEVSVYTSAMGTKRIAYNSPLIKERAQEGVAFSFLSPHTDANMEARDELSVAGAALRETATDFGAITLMFLDDKEVILAHHVPDDGHYFQGSDVAIWSDDPAMVRTLKSFFTMAWKLSEMATTPASKAQAAALGNMLKTIAPQAMA